MTKYIIKNCPAYIKVDDDWDCISDNVTQTKCQDCTDCTMKRIVEKCKEQKEPQIRDYKTDIEYFRYSARHSLAKDILSMLEIEECEE